MMVRQRWSLLAGLTALLISLASCTTSPDSAEDDLLNVTAVTVTGEDFSGTELVGEPVVLWFWTPWCTVCRSEAPGIADVEAQFGDSVRFVGVAAQGPTEDMVTFINQTGVGGFTHLDDRSADVWGHFGVVSQPSYVFISRDGTAERVVGTLSTSALTDRVQRLIE
jgi:thiol-disulfide isomerase/thioredoxin